MGEHRSRQCFLLCCNQTALREMLWGASASVELAAPPPLPLTCKYYWLQWSHMQPNRFATMYLLSRDSVCGRLQKRHCGAAGEVRRTHLSQAARVTRLQWHHESTREHTTTHTPPTASNYGLSRTSSVVRIRGEYDEARSYKKNSTCPANLSIIITFLICIGYSVFFHFYIHPIYSQLHTLMFFNL